MLALNPYIFLSVLHISSIHPLPENPGCYFIFRDCPNQKVVGFVSMSLFAMPAGWPYSGISSCHWKFTRRKTQEASGDVCDTAKSLGLTAFLDLQSGPRRDIMLECLSTWPPFPKEQDSQLLTLLLKLCPSSLSFHDVLTKEYNSMTTVLVNFCSWHFIALSSPILCHVTL